MVLIITTWFKRWKLGQVRFRKDVWDCYWGRVSLRLADVFSLSPVTVQEVFVSSFLSVFKVAIMVSFQAWSTMVWQSKHG